MKKPELKTVEAVSETIQLVTFSVGDILLGVEISDVQEINRHLDITKVPEASPMIHGVVNLRGDVVTVLDLHKILELPPSRSPEKCRNLILNVDGERIGVLVDRVSDILTVRRTDMTQRPSNVRSIDRRFIDSVYLRDEEIVVVLNAGQMLDTIEQPSEGSKSAA